MLIKSCSQRKTELNFSLFFEKYKTKCFRKDNGGYLKIYFNCDMFYNWQLMYYKTYTEIIFKIYCTFATLHFKWRHCILNEDIWKMQITQNH